MSTELSMLTWTAGVTALMWIPYILAHIMNVGLMPAITYQADETPKPAWAERAKRAHYNAIENLVPFAALVLVAHIIGVSNTATASAAVVYFVARVAHYLLYMSGVPFARTITFAIGWAAMVCIFWQIVTAGAA